MVCRSAVGGRWRSFKDAWERKQTQASRVRNTQLGGCTHTREPTLDTIHTAHSASFLACAHWQPW